MSESPTDVTLQDRAEIAELFARQAHAIDGGDAAGWAATFTADGRFVSPTYKLTATGPAELTTFADNSNSGALARGEQLRHYMSQTVITVVGPGVFRVDGYLTIMATSRDGARVDRSLVVLDELHRVDGTWLVHSRTVFNDQAAMTARANGQEGS
jgi:ketosteroid isomerase-like protein